MICLKVKTLDSQTYDFTVDNEISVRQFKETIAEKTNISADLQRIIYCGRVLSDEKQLKEYDVNGKVVHVVERPPPSSRATTNIIDTSNRRQRDELDATIRQSPIFRALDGMVVGAMTIPVSAAGGQPTQAPIPPLNPSSSFCMNRITVARHMLECANNIALYLENPERGLNNSSLDILTQGRWTMESTVFEVGISAAVEIPQNQTQNLVGALRGAVSAALQNGHPNVTVVQLPTVFGSNGSAATAAPPPQQQSTVSGGTGNQQSSPDENAANEDAEISNETAESGASEPAAENSESSTPDFATPETGTESNTNSANPSWQRTNTRILGEVVQQMRTVQTRLEPYIQQYYDILMNDPQFEENDTTGPENAQRVFDRVSEALHYMSHAQHAISDLMLELSQPTPRYLCCRPILVEQGVRSNNYLASFLQPSMNNNESNNNSTGGTNQSARPSAPPMPTSGTGESTENLNARSQLIFAPANTNQQQSQSQNTGVPTSVNVNSTVGQGQSQNDTNVNSQGYRNILIPPIFMPMRNQSSTNTINSTSTTANANLNSSESNHTMTPPLFLPVLNRTSSTNSTNIHIEPGNQEGQPIAGIVLNLAPRRVLIPNPQLQVARLIQAVVNSAPLDADLHVQINAPNFGFGFGMPMGGGGGGGGGNGNTTAASQQQQQRPQQQQQQQQTQPISQNQSASQSNTSSVNNQNDANSETTQPRVTTATHPTTSTQTRSTPRPQVHIANLPSAWNARVIPANMLSSFDRFLPCSSHHIRENETELSDQSLMINGLPRRRQRRQPQEATAASFTPDRTSTPQPTPTSRTNPDISNLSNEEFNIPLNIFGSNLTLRDLIDIAPSVNTLNRIRSELHAFIVNTLFAGAPITDENMNNAINHVIQLLSDALIFLPQYDLPDYDARASVENFIRNSLPFIINLIREDDSTEFGTRLLRELVTFVRRLFVILVTCVGRSNAELYINQIAQMAITSNNDLEQEALRVLQRHLMAAVIRELDLTRQNTSDVQEFLVIRRPSTESQNDEVTPMETDEISVQQENIGQEKQIIESKQSTSQTETENTQLNLVEQTLAPPKPVRSDEPLPTVIPGSEPWHNNFPTNWLPIITRDIEKQRRQNPQAPFSDAYISGMSAKRRKLVTSSKSPIDVPSLVTEGVRRAIHTVGVAPPNGSSIEEISATIGTDSSTQLSYREALRSSICERLRTDPDFNSDKFPNSSRYFKK